MKRPGLIITALSALLAATPASAHWVRGWHGAAQKPLGNDLEKMPPISNVRIEQVMRVTAGGPRIRLRLSNEFSAETLRLGSVRVSNLGNACKRGSGQERQVRFADLKQGELAAGASTVSTAVPLRVAAWDCVLVSFEVLNTIARPTVHRMGLGDTLVVPLAAVPQDANAAAGQASQPTAAMPGKTIRSGMRFYLSGIDVDMPKPNRVIVAIGDSITDGAGSTANADRRWPDMLQRRLTVAALPRSVVNAGISGNRILKEGTGTSLLARFDRDALDVPGVGYVIVLEGINDLGAAVREGGTPNGAALIDGLRQIVSRAHSRGVKVLGGTIMPFKGSKSFRQDAEQARQEVNAWIRTPGNFDGVVDFDAAVRDPADAEQLLAAYHGGDFLHPNDAGYRQMAEAIDLKLFNEAGNRKSSR